MFQYIVINNKKMSLHNNIYLNSNNVLIIVYFIGVRLLTTNINNS